MISVTPNLEDGPGKETTISIPGMQAGLPITQMGGSKKDKPGKTSFLHVHF
jgi:hypothetical protein